MKGRILSYVIALFLFMNGWGVASPPMGNIPTVPAPPGAPGPRPLQPKPDLVTQSITFTNNTPVIGQYFDIKVTVTNRGAGINPATMQRVTTTSGPSNLLIKVGGESGGEVIPVPQLTTGQSATLTRHYRHSVPADLVVRAIVDPTNTVIESREDNNEKTKTLRIWPLPDLKIVDFHTVPQGTLRLPGSFRVVATVKNLGGPSPQTTMQFDIDGDIPNYNDVVEHITRTVQALSPNQSVPVKLDYTPVRPGTYTLGGKVDPNDQVREAHEHNNYPPLIQLRVLEGGADLDLVSLVPNHTQRHWYQDFVVTATIRNRGNLSSGPFKVHLYRLHDKPAGWAQGSLKDEVRQCGSLGPNGVCTVQFTFQYKVFVGDPRVEVKVDPEGGVNDYNRANNQRHLSLRVL